MARRRLLLLLKPFDVLPTNQSDNNLHFRNPKVLKYLDNRRLVHKEAINFCQNILRKKLVDWEAVYRFNLSRPIRDVDLVVTIGGDGTLLQASHFLDNSIPVLGVNSDPTQTKEVEEYSEEFDASRSTGFLCAATVKNFEQIIDDILVNRARPSEVSKITKREEQSCSSLVHCRSSGLRVSTAAVSTAAMLSAGGIAMPILSKDLQYIVREPIAPGAYNSRMHGLVKPEELMEIAWYCKEGLIYIDGSHLVHSVQHGDIIELSSNAPTLKVFLPSHLIS